MHSASAPLSILALALVPACAGPTINDPVAALALAEAHLEATENGAALELLEAMDDDMFVGEDLERYQVRHAQALERTGYRWDAFDRTRDFGERFAFSDYVVDVQDLQYSAGAWLIQSDGGFLFFTSDADDGQVILQHFALRWPNHPAAADALRLLGEKAYGEAEYQLATQRFGDIVKYHENSEWVPLARFRIAMASYFDLEGPDYDLRSMRRAHNELRDFLQMRIENPTFTAEATAAFTRVREWLGEKHVRIADFYDTVGNELGLRFHLSEAAERFPDTAAGQRATVLLAELGPEPPSPDEEDAPK